MPQLLRKGWPAHRVRERYLEHAQAAVDAGVEFRPVQPEERPAVEQLLNERLLSDHGITLAADAGGIKAVHQGELVGVIIVEGIAVDNEVAARVTAVTVIPSWEHRGLGTVLLGMIPALRSDIRFVYGGCAEDASPFYQRAGYDVLKPGEALPFNLGPGAQFFSSNTHYPCWFIRSLR